MGMIIPKSTSALIKKYQNALFYETTEPKSERIYTFYLLLRPKLNWLAKIIKKYGLEKDEIESELYIYVADLFEYYNPNKSSIIPYLEKYIPWKTTHLINKLEKHTLKEDLDASSMVQKTYHTHEQFYWDPNKILFENRYVGKVFTTAEKYCIYKILLLNKLDITTTNLAKELGISRITMINKLKELQELEEIKPWLE